MVVVVVQLDIRNLVKSEFHQNFKRVRGYSSINNSCLFIHKMHNLFKSKTKTKNFSDAEIFFLFFVVRICWMNSFSCFVLSKNKARSSIFKNSSSLLPEEKNTKLPFWFVFESYTTCFKKRFHFQQKKANLQMNIQTFFGYNQTFPFVRPFWLFIHYYNRLYIWCILCI